MITSLVFSLLAFFIVASTTVLVIKNKSKVNSISKNFTQTQQQISNDKHNNHARMNNLVNEINLNNTKLENEQKQLKKDVDLNNTKQNEKLQNLDKRFNSYKNITTANFMGMNNRMTSENQRLKDDIALNELKIAENRRYTESNIDAINTSMQQQTHAFDEFYKNDYTTNIERLDSWNQTNSSNLTAFIDSMSQSIIDSSNMNLSARQALNTIVNTKYDNVSSSLGNFFNMDSNFVNTHNSQTNNSNLFRNWYDNYYNISSRTNFNNMDELILMADQKFTTVDDHDTSLSNLQTQVDLNTQQLNPSVNLFKSNIHDYVKDTYNFDLTNLSTIASNAQDITTLNSNITSLSNTLNQIGIFDVRTEGTITLDDLFQSIQSNQQSIQSNQVNINNLFDNKFNTYLGSNLPDYYNTISQNISETDIISKLEGTNLNLTNLTLSNTLDVGGNTTVTGDLDVTGSLFINGNDFKDRVNVNKNYIDTLENKVFDLNLVDGKSIPTKDYLAGGDPLIKAKTNTNTDTEIRASSGDQGESVELKAGADLIMSRRNYFTDASKVGGKLFVDSFDDIGTNDYDQFGFKQNIDGSTKRYQFKESLGDKLRSVDSNIDSIKNDIQGISDTIENDGVSKSQLYNVINNVPNDEKLVGNYGRGPYNEIKDVSFRINNLYTGEPSQACLANSVTNDSLKCKTIDERLSDLETANAGTDLLSPAVTAINNMGISHLADTESVKINKPLILTSTLSVNGVTSVSALNVSGVLTADNEILVGENDSSKLTLSDINDLRIKKSGGTTTQYEGLSDHFVGKSNIGYIKNVAELNDNSGFTVTKGDNSTTTISFPSSPAYTVENTDLKSIETISGIGFGDIPSTDLNVYKFKPYNSTGNGGLLDTTIKIPKRFVYNVTENSGNGTYTVKNFDNGDITDVTIQPGVQSKNEILDKLNETTTSTTKPRFENGILLGDRCLYYDTSAGGLKICNSSCGECEDIWDTRSAPRPVTTTSPMADTS